MPHFISVFSSANRAYRAISLLEATSQLLIEHNVNSALLGASASIWSDIHRFAALSKF
jgi:hypothetical protein